MRRIRTWLRVNRYVPWHVRLLGMVGHWGWEHEFKTCPSGERICPHMRWRFGKG